MCVTGGLSLCATMLSRFHFISVLTSIRVGCGMCNVGGAAYIGSGGGGGSRVFTLAFVAPVRGPLVA
jgi:hypothetical protein